MAASDTTATGAASLPNLVGRAYGCGLDSPLTTAVGSSAVVGLLCRGDAELAQAAAALAAAAVGDDAVAGALLAAVAGAVTYVADPDGAAVWTCALGTYFRGSGNCEDGAILLQALLLAAGLPADRLVTAFGRVGLDRTDHAWVAYRRQSDGLWTVLDWTLGPQQGPVAGLPVLGGADYPAVVDYALTAGAFFAVRQDAAVFFATSRADQVALPVLGLEATASLGLRGAIAWPDGWLTAWGQGAGGGEGPFPRLQLVATAGSAGAFWGLPVPIVAARTGALMDCVWPCFAETAWAGSNAKGPVRLGLPHCQATAVTPVAAAGSVVLAGARGNGQGLAGIGGGAGCLLPRVVVRLRGTAGSLVPGELLLPLPACVAAEAADRSAGADLMPAAWGATAWGNLHGLTTGLGPVLGEEW